MFFIQGKVLMEKIN